MSRRDDSGERPSSERSHAGTLSREVLDHLSEGCQIVGFDWRYLYLNEVAARHGRNSRGEMLGRTMMEVYPGIDRTPMFEALRRCRDARTVELLENEFAFPDGSTGCFELRIEPVPEGVFVLSLDITERKRGERALARANRALAVLSDCNQALIRATDEGLLLQEICDVGVGTGSYPLVWIGLREGDRPGERAGFACAGLAGTASLVARHEWEEAQAGRGPAADALLRAGEALPRSQTASGPKGEAAGPRSTSCLALPLLGQTGVVGVLTLHGSDDAFDTSELALLQELAADLAFGVATIRQNRARHAAEARVRHLNAVLAGIRGVNQLIVRERDPQALIERACALLVASRGFDTCSILLPDHDGRRLVADAGEESKLRALRRLLAGGEPPRCVAHALHVGGLYLRQNPTETCPTCPVSLEHGADRDTLAVQLAHEGRSYGALMVSIPPLVAVDPEEQALLQEIAGDLAFALRGMELATEREFLDQGLRKTEEQLRQAQKMEAVGRLAGGVAHDFNNMLSVVLCHAGFVTEDLPPGDPLRDDVEQIRLAGERAAGLTRQLLAFSRQQVLAPEPLDLNEVVEGMEKLLHRLIGEDVTLRTAFAPGPVRVHADRGQLEQVVMNLAINARDAMPRGGTLLLETARLDLDAVEGSRTGGGTGPHALLAVSDTGDGMDAATQARAFEPFFTTKPPGKGTGLGLSTVDGIVRQSGGTIWLYSEPGRGTTFKIYLPELEGEPEAVLRPTPPPLAGGKETILIVEDEDAVRRAACGILRRHGYDLLEAANAAEALEFAARHQGVIHLLLTDVVMPVSSGRDLAECLAAFRPGTPVLFMSGYTDSSILQQQVLEAGADFLQKPLTADRLARKVREVLDRRGAE